MKEFLINLLARENVLDSAQELEPYCQDFTEAEPEKPCAVAFVTTVEQVQEIIKAASRDAKGVSITPRIAGTNIGGLAIPAEGGIILDMSRMNRIVEINEKDMYAVIEPGVTQKQLKDYLQQKNIKLTFGYSLGPPDTSILANCLMGGLTNRSLKYGDMSQWISGIEVVLSDGTVAKIGSWSLSDKPFGLVPFPGLAGLFVAWQATTGIVTKMAFQLYPEHPFNKRLFILTYSPKGTFESVRRLIRKEICDDIGGLSWTSGKMMLGVKHPSPVPCPGEPLFFLYVDLTAEIEQEMEIKEKILWNVLEEMRREGEKIEEPLDVNTLVRVNPDMKQFAEFPTDLKFLTDHGGGGLTWIGTYGPLSRFEECIEKGSSVMVRHGFPPTIVTRPMRGGHYGVLRFVTIFDKKNEEQVRQVKALNHELLDTVTGIGFVIYKTPIWAWKVIAPKIDPGMLSLLGKIKKTMDPDHIFNRGKLGF